MYNESPEAVQQKANQVLKILSDKIADIYIKNQQRD